MMEETAPGKEQCSCISWLAGRCVLAILMSVEYEVLLIIQINEGSKPEKPFEGSRAE